MLGVGCLHKKSTDVRHLVGMTYVFVVIAVVPIVTSVDQKYTECSLKCFNPLRVCMWGVPLKVDDKILAILTVDNKILAMTSNILIVSLTDGSIVYYTHTRNRIIAGCCQSV